MPHFDLAKKYTDYNGNEITISLQEGKFGSLVVVEASRDAGNWMMTYTHCNNGGYLNASVPVVDTEGLQLAVQQLKAAEDDNDKDQYQYLSSVVATIRVGLPRPSQEMWVDAYSCHNSECSTPLVVMRAKATNLVQIGIPYTKIASGCVCCRILESVANHLLDAYPSADLQNTWIYAHVDSGGFNLGRLRIAAPLKDLKEVELHTFLEEARREPDDVMATFLLKCIDDNRLLSIGDIRKELGWLLQCSLYYDSSNELPGWPKLPSLRPIPIHPLDDPCILFIKDCWNECERHHSSCVPSQRLLRPQRLLYVGEHTGSVIRLLDENVDQVKYCALSYCWGTSEVLLLTRSTFREFKQEVPWDVLSRTHQDAIQIARKLSITYLWIDALCIIQDDRTDWFEEASKMRDIYGSGELVICADNSGDSGSGFLRERSDERQWPLPERPKYLNVKQQETDDEVKLCLWTERLLNPSEEFRPKLPAWNSHLIHGNIPAEEPITERAWCLQEYLSARRCVRFTSQEVIWDCRGHLRCECGRTITTPGVTGLFKQEFHHILNQASPLSREFIGQWRDIVANYSARKLSQESDKLMAIAGLAKEFALSWDIGPFCAGRWEHDGNMLNTLLWGPHGNSKLTRSQKYIAPGWSWASTVGALDLLRYFKGFNDDQDCTNWSWIAEVLDGDARLAGNNDFGPVSDGYLRLAAPCLRAVFKDPEVSKFQIPQPIKVAMGDDVEPRLLIEWPEVQTSLVSWHMDVDKHNAVADTIVICLVVYRDYDDSRSTYRYVAIMCVPDTQHHDILGKIGQNDGEELHADTTDAATVRNSSEEGEETSNDVEELILKRVGIAEIWADNNDEWPVYEVLLV